MQGDPAKRGRLRVVQEQPPAQAATRVNELLADSL